VAPTMKNPHFGNAWVFRVDPARGWQSFSNEADFVLLSAPDGTPLEAVEWGDKKDALPSAMPRNKIYSVPWDITESVQRLGSTDQWLPHTQINGKYFSPGEVPTRRMPILPK
jgi:hypothetical protein